MPWDVEAGKKLIKAVANDYEYEITERGETSFEITKDHWHSVAFKVLHNNSDYLQVHQWEEGPDDDGSFGRAIYSLRSSAQVAMFCNIVTMSAIIRAKR